MQYPVKSTITSDVDALDAMAVEWIREHGRPNVAAVQDAIERSDRLGDPFRDNAFRRALIRVAEDPWDPHYMRHLPGEDDRDLRWTAVWITPEPAQGDAAVRSTTSGCGCEVALTEHDNLVIDGEPVRWEDLAGALRRRGTCPDAFDCAMDVRWKLGDPEAVDNTLI